MTFLGTILHLITLGAMAGLTLMLVRLYRGVTASAPIGETSWRTARMLVGMALLPALWAITAAANGFYLRPDSLVALASWYLALGVAQRTAQTLANPTVLLAALLLTGEGILIHSNFPILIRSKIFGNHHAGWDTLGVLTLIVLFLAWRYKSPQDLEGCRRRPHLFWILAGGTSLSFALLFTGNSVKQVLPAWMPLYISYFLALSVMGAENLMAYQTQTRVFPQWMSRWQPLLLWLGGILVAPIIASDFAPAIICVSTTIMVLATHGQLANALQFLFASVGVLWVAWIQLFIPKFLERIAGSADYVNAFSSQKIQTLWATALGGVSGNGIGVVVRPILPTPHTDAVLASAAQTIGLAGVTCLLIQIGVLTLALFWSAQNAPAPWLRILLRSGAWLVLFSTAIAGAWEVFPVPIAGAAVPFVSWGKANQLVSALLVWMALCVQNLPPGTATPANDRTHLLPSLRYCEVGFVCVLLTLLWFGFARIGIIVRESLLAEQYRGAARQEWLHKKIASGDVAIQNGVPVVLPHVPRGPANVLNSEIVKKRVFVRDGRVVVAEPQAFLQSEPSGYGDALRMAK